MRVLQVVHELDAGAGVFGAFPMWVPGNQPPPDPQDVDALMIFGGSMHVDQSDEHRWMDPEKEFIRSALDSGTPILGVCLGSQLLAEAAGAQPERMSEPEIGWYEIELTEAGTEDPLLGPLAPSVELFEWHHYATPLPPGAVELARTPASLQAFRLDGRPVWGLQFHAEVSREDLFNWLDGWEESEAVDTSFDPDEIRAASELRIDEQNEIGRGIAERFLAEAARETSR